eukprot:1849424-Rhodomonas_salina.5
MVPRSSAARLRCVRGKASWNPPRRRVSPSDIASERQQSKSKRNRTQRKGTESKAKRDVQQSTPKESKGKHSTEKQIKAKQKEGRGSARMTLMHIS